MSPDASQPLPRRVVAMGGGTGLPVMLRGLRCIAGSQDVTQLTAVVTMTDDGGSSGRLRESLGLPPPGDVRNCLVALSEEEDLLAALFQHRYRDARELDGHNLGNLILAALAEQTGSFLRAVEVSSRVLRTSGQILPATFDDVRLEAVLADGSRIRGETAIDACDERISRVMLCPEDAQATPGVIEAIHGADLVVLGPGSLYTSVIPNIVVGGVAEALKETAAVVVMIGNLVTERDTRELGLAEHIEAVQRHAGADVIDALLVHEGPANATVLERYAAEGARILTWDGGGATAVRVFKHNLLADGPKLRHDPISAARGAVHAWATLSSNSTKVSRFPGAGGQSASGIAG